MLELNINFDQPDLPATGEYRRHLLARVTPPVHDQKEGVVPLDLALVIDASGSMHGAPLDAAKQAAATIAQELDESTRLTIVSFSNDVVVHVDGVALDAAGKAEVLAKIATLDSRGSTDLHAGWLTGCTILNEAGETGSCRRHVVVLSDGYANQGVVAVDRLAEQARQQLDRGVTTSCVGIGDDYSPTQLLALSDYGGGACHDAVDAEEIVEILLGEVRSLGDVVAEDLELVLSVPKGVRAAELSGMPSVFDGMQLRVRMGSIRASRSREVVIRVDGDASYGALSVSAELSWRLPGETSRQRVEVPVAEAAPTLESVALPSARDASAVLVAWQADIVRWIAAYNRDRNRVAIRRLWQRDYDPFIEYALQLPETVDFVGTIRAIHAGSHRQMSERRLKQSVDLSRKMARNEDAYYSLSRGDVAAQFAPEQGRRGTRGQR
jgi:Ca-activated chloride channel homolog